MLDSANRSFLKKHDVGRIYLRMFDVVEDPEAGTVTDYRVVPNASMRFGMPEYEMFDDSLANLEFVPVVYITLEALKASKGEEGRLAANIVERVKNMCRYHDLKNVGELQLDCDWTASTENSFFTLCDSVRTRMAHFSLSWSLSSTIRLHQLSRKVPPVDRGVLMVYNTGNFNDPDGYNSILSLRDIKPYLKSLSRYPLHLDVAYPTYSWQLLFRDRKFVGLIDGLDLEDTDRFVRKSENVFVAINDIPYNNRVIRQGDVVREENSSFQEVDAVRRLIEQRLSGRPHANVLYHLDSDNLSNYSPYEINTLFKTRN